MRLSFLRASVPVYLGGRSIGAGPLRVRWGGRWFAVEPITFVHALGLSTIVAEMGGQELLAGGPGSVPPACGRVMVPLLVAGFRPGRDDRHLGKATDAQIATALATAAAVNGWKLLQEIVTPPTQQQGPHDDGALDRAIVVLGEKFGLWPHEVMSKPYVEVQAVMDAVAAASGDRNVDDSTADQVKRLSAEREARHA